MNCDKTLVDYFGGMNKYFCYFCYKQRNKFWPSLASLFHSSIDSGIFPGEWKVARVTPTLKNDAKSDQIAVEVLFFFLTISTPS